MNAQRLISLGFTEERVLEGRHICYIYNDDAERRQVISQYLQSGLRAKERVLYLVDTMSPDQFLESMKGLGVNLENLAPGFCLKQALPVYCPGGTFSCPDMLDVVGTFYQQSLRDGFVGARGTGEMSWCLVEGVAQMDDLMEYESRLNIILQEHPYTTCCQYDARRFDGETILNVLNVHPLMIVRGQIVRNPFYQEPSTFLATHRRKTEQAVNG